MSRLLGLIISIMDVGQLYRLVPFDPVAAVNHFHVTDSWSQYRFRMMVCRRHVCIRFSWWYLPCVTAWSYVIAGLLLGMPHLFLVFGGSSSTGLSWRFLVCHGCLWWLHPSLCLAGFFHHCLMDWFHLFEVPKLLPWFSLGPDNGLRGSSDLIR